MLPVPVTKGATYLVVVGSRGESAPGDFTLQVLRGQPPERAPGKQLQNGSARGTLNGLTNVNDIWWVAMQPGSTYRVAMSSRPCVPMALRQRGLTLRSMSCGGYSTFTPGPDGGGRYVIELIAPPGAGSASYRLQFAKAGPDDIGVGPELKNLATARGALAPAGVDVVDVFHFDVAERSDVRLRLGGASDYSLVLLTDSGFRLASSGDQIRRQLERGRYVLAVRGEIGAAASRYTLGLVIRRLTVTTLKIAVPEVLPGVPRDALPRDDADARCGEGEAPDRPLRPARGLAVLLAAPRLDRDGLCLLGSAGARTLEVPCGVHGHADVQPEPKRLRLRARRTAAAAGYGPACDGRTKRRGRRARCAGPSSGSGQVGAAGPAACACCYCGHQLERVRSARVRLPNAFVKMWWEVYFYGRRNR